MITLASVHTHTHMLTRSRTVRSTDSWMTLCGALAVREGGEVSCQTTVAMYKANKRANQEFSVH